MKTSVFIELIEGNAFCRSKPEVFPSQKTLTGTYRPFDCKSYLWLQCIGIVYSNLYLK